MKSYPYYQELFNVAGKVAIVTGASGTGQGLGRVFAVALAKAGCNVVVCARSMDGLKETERQVHEVSDVECTCIKCDVTIESDIDNVVNTTIEKYGRIDILVNNAGVPCVKNFFDYTKEDWNYVMDVNMTGLFLFAQKCAVHMKKQHYGKIVNLGSMNCHAVTRCNPIYVTSKGAILQFSKAIGNDLIEYGINVNTLSPGVFLDPSNMTDDPADKAKVGFVTAAQPMKRTGRMEELEGALLYLCSDASSYCVGSEILIDGGMNTLAYENPFVNERYL